MLLKEALQSVTAIVLASGSPRRRELLDQMLPKDVDSVVQKSTFGRECSRRMRSRVCIVSPWMSWDCCHSSE